MHKQKVIVIAALGLITAAILYFFFILKPHKTQLPGMRDFNVILITVDTLRADRIGCYGFSEIDTPTIDMFAQQGIRFETCIAQTPLTLPSHTSLLTGTHPTYHGVRDNGGFIVPPELSTMAEIMQQNGYQTSAFVSAYVLDSKWGLDQGFDFYFDQFDLSQYKTISLGHVQRRGDAVIDEVLPWLDSHKQNKFFSWIHLYDPHTPYDPPSPFLERYPNQPYVGEIAYTDSQLARLWEYLERNDLIENTLLIFTSDHGESLGEHNEGTHGFFIYQAGVHVPLILVSPFSELKGKVRSSVVSLVDILPTVLEWVDLPIPPQVQGRSLVPLLMSEETRDDDIAYCETFYPRYHYGWSELQSIQDKKFKLIAAPNLELYDLTLDPQEGNNLISSHAAEARRMLNILEEFNRSTSENAFEIDFRHMDEAARQKLAALGYIGTFTDASSLQGQSLADPKEKISIFNQLSKARELSLENEFDQAEEMMESIISLEPELVDAYSALGNLYYKQRKFDLALKTFYEVLEKRPNDSFTVINIANTLQRMDKLDEAERFILDTLEFLPPDSQIYLILGNINNLKKNYEQAISHYEKCIELNPASASAINGLGGIYIVLLDLDKARTYLDRVADINPKLKDLHYHFAQLHEAQEDIPKAITAYKQELENIPYNFRASYNLARLYRIQGNVSEEEVYLEKTMESNPEFSLSYFFLARIYLNRQEKYTEAISLVETGLTKKVEKEYLPLGYFLLSDLYNRVGNYSKSAEFLEKGKQAQADVSRKDG